MIRFASFSDRFRWPVILVWIAIVAVGASAKDRGALAGTDWHGRLHFAGEACAQDFPATAHGALNTGRAAAAAILAARPGPASD